MFDGIGMSTSPSRRLAQPLGARLGARVREERVRRGWTLRELAARSGLSASQVQWIEAGNPGSLAAYAAIAAAFRLRPEFDLVDPRRQQRNRSEDPVHAAMGDLEVARLRRPGVSVGLDEPYQHYQFAGRADLVAWSVDRRALLHMENRTRFPNYQDAFGSYNAKRQWLAAAIAQRAGIPHGFDSVTHVIAALWSSEVLHALRLRTASFEAVCPDPAAAFERWWAGTDPLPGVHSCLVVIDPAATGRRRTWVDMQTALSVRPRHGGYAAALEAIERSAGRR